VSQSANRQAGETDYPSNKVISLLALETIVKKLNKFKMHTYSLEILIKISRRWVYENKPSTIYYISDGDNNRMAANYEKVSLLIKKGLIEVVAVGRYNSKSYAPTPAGLDALKPLCSVA